MSEDKGHTVSIDGCGCFIACLGIALVILACGAVLQVLR